MSAIKVILYYVTICFLCSYEGFKESKVCPFIDDVKIIIS